MNIEEAIKEAQETTGELLLMAKPPLTWGSEAIFVSIGDDFSEVKQAQAKGYESILDRDDLMQLIHFLRRKKISSKAIAEFVIHYAQNDAYPSWLDDIPDK